LQAIEENQMLDKVFKVAVILGVVLLAIIAVKVWSGPGTIGRYQAACDSDGHLRVIDTATGKAFQLDMGTGDLYVWEQYTESVEEPKQKVLTYDFSKLPDQPKAQPPTSKEIGK